MKAKFDQEIIDRLTRQLLQNYTTPKAHEIFEDELFSHFMTRIQQQIKYQRNLSQVWEVGVFSARKWLFAFCCIAVFFFFGNLLVIGNKTSSHLNVQSFSSEVSEIEDNDYIHAPNERILDNEMIRKE